jgi:hypothetical protein
LQKVFFRLPFGGKETSVFRLLSVEIPLRFQYMKRNGSFIFSDNRLPFPGGNEGKGEKDWERG